MIKKLLIANRGEIAVRIARAAKELDIDTVAVYSEADKDALHVRMANEAVFIGSSEPSESYLKAESIIQAALQSGAQAIHPGYGFLSERASFAEACGKSGLIFVGPSADAMKSLGSKIDSKKLAVENQVPITPGYFEPNASHEELLKQAAIIGYPLMLKASAGGGGRGMRIVRNPDDFYSELEIASSEAVKAFGDGTMMIEKLVERPRHIEVQILADDFGRVACLFERDCSLQRRHQKLVEESPSPYFQINPGMWDQMKACAQRLIKVASYTGAGTVEFMVDEASNEFYFLEVNARLQVEHPVTECVTGLDLVKWQLRISSGQPLEIPGGLLEGNRNSIRGHCIEARVVAEDPTKGFMPSIGPIQAWIEPKAPGIRFDTGYGPGATISRFYDSLLGKVIAHAETRQECIDRLIVALQNTHILGVSTNISYLIHVLDSPGFRSGKVDTGFLGREFSEWNDSGELPDELEAITAAATRQATVNGVIRTTQQTAWDKLDDFRNVR